MIFLPKRIVMNSSRQLEEKVVTCLTEGLRICKKTNQYRYKHHRVKSPSWDKYP